MMMMHQIDPDSMHGMIESRENLWLQIQLEQKVSSSLNWKVPLMFIIVLESWQHLYHGYYLMLVCILWWDIRQRKEKWGAYWQNNIIDQL